MDTFGLPSVQTSGGYYAGIGYEQTESVHFEDLKAKQEILGMKAVEVVKEYKVLAKLEKESKALKRAKVLKAKEKREKADQEKADDEKADKEGKESDNEDDDDDDDDNDLELTMRFHTYCAARQDVMDLTRSWAKEGSNQIAAFPGQRDKERTKRTIDFINLIKIKMRKTTPIGMEEESPEDHQWLENFTTTLPEPDEMAVAAGEGKGLKSRLRGAASAMMTAMNSPRKAFSSIRTSTPDTGKAKDDEGLQKKMRRRDERGRYAKDIAENQSVPSKEAPISNLGEDLDMEAGKKGMETNDKGGEEEGEEEEADEEKRQKEAILRERAADLIKLTGNLKLAKELKEADDKLKVARQEAEEEARKAKEEEERIQREEEEAKAKNERKREEEEEELRDILKQIVEMEKKEKERKVMAIRKTEMMKKKREAKESESSKREEKVAEKKKAPHQKEKKASVLRFQEEEEEDEEEEKGKWQPVNNKKGKKSKKRREKERMASSSSEEASSSETETDSSDEDEKKGKTMKQVKMEQLARSRMVEARPKGEEEKFGDNGMVTYQSFKNRFNAVAKAEGINPLDVLNEIGNWLTGTPKRMADAYKGAEDPRQAMKDIWEQLDRYYTIKSLTAHERIQPILKKGNVTKEDIDAHIELVADLANVKTEAKIAKMEKQLDRVDIVRDLINGKLSYLSEEFYIEEAKEKRENANFRYKFQDVIDVASEKAQILKARGISSKKTAKTAGVAATQMMSTGQMQYNEVVENSPPKLQQPASSCECCQSTQHSIQNCNKLWNMKLEDRMVELRKFQYCFRCMLKGHIAKFCKNKPVKCGKCNLLGHPNILHGIRELRQQQQQQRIAAAAAAAADPSSGTNNSTTASNHNGRAPNTSSANQPSTSSNQPTPPGNQNHGETSSR